MFHANFWAHLEMNLETGQFVEAGNPLNTPATLYRMTEPQFMVERLKDDLALQLYAVARGYARGLDRERLNKLVAHLDYRTDWNREEELPRQARQLLDRYSLRATQFVLEKAREFARQNRKKLLIVLFDPFRAMKEMRESGTRYDQRIVDFLKKEKFDYFDMNEVQLRDFARYRIPFDEYMKLYFIGHYNPRGNPFFAYSIKDKIVSWLDPQPVPYRKRDEESVDFKEYLQPVR
jgi:hypothetical protein